jgi:hypothetical protein
VQATPHNGTQLPQQLPPLREYLLFEQVSAKADLKMEVVLTEESADKTGEFVYIYLEPLADAVIALGYPEQKMSVTAPGILWWIHDRAVMTLIGEAERLLQHGDIIESLLFSIERFSEILLSRDPRQTRLS